MDSFIKACIALTQSKENLVVIYSKGQFLGTEQNQTLFPLVDFQALIDQTHAQTISIGLWNNSPVYLAIIAEQLEVPLMSWHSLRPLMLQMDAMTYKILGYATQIAVWNNDNKFCGRCGTLMQISQTEYRKICPQCKFTAYPRLNPSMIILVTKGDKLLLARSPRFAPGMYSTLAGFVEAGESVEDCVHREVTEEVGITIKNVRYIASQNWPYPNSLMLGYHAEYAAGTLTPQLAELEDAKWFSVENLPILPPKQAISRYLIDLFLAKQLGLNKPVFPN